MKSIYITPNMRITNLYAGHILCGSPVTYDNNIIVDDSPADFSDDLSKRLGIILENCDEEE